MTQPQRVSVRELRNHVSEVLRRVEAGETLEVTVNERPVALLVPRHERPSTVPTRSFFAELPLADPGLRDELSAELIETTEDSRDPWQG
ncbi:type II toxin-antitoxin system prevent-host-death family antitoxin [Nocardia sp. SYP-A9097]|uniref:type II toxin-antitoxin system Phd/YefM family antitoxin n=1 Tax=Nocardia sp. SYP-A9097 TaxID=2663237 RepID=UPI00129B6AE3|nr:type II toxin-antitoxin system prevent-host-death family antitoxin [Nocardia sp. SYP-A9097]MRH86980.1 type II toxin-antitoxin system prevent-host-death family antitoxin [Nocardia sp. SYP-A9097]